MSSLFVDIFYYVLHYPFLLLLIPIIVWIFNVLGQPVASQRILGGVAVVSIVLAGIMFIAAFPSATRNDWCANRLSPAIAWMMGDRLYHLPGEGPALTRIYGPVTFIIYTPAAIGSSPTVAVLIAAGINLILFLLPAIWLIRTSLPSCRRIILASAMGFFLILSARNYTLLFVAHMVSTDAPAIGLAACACALLISARDTASPVKTGLRCGLAAALALWSKQTVTPLIPALILYVLLSRDLLWAVRFSAAICGVLLAVSITFIAIFGARELYFNLITLPASRPWQRDWLSGLVPVSRAIFWIWRDMLPIGWTLVIAAGIAASDVYQVRSAGLRQWALRNPWLLPLLVAVLTLPICAYSYAQVGGQDNVGSPSIYFALLTAAIALATVAGSDPATEISRPRTQLAKLCLVIFMLGSCIAYPKDWLNLPARLAIWNDLYNNRQEQAVHYARQHAGKVYFPAHPLASMYAEHRIYHFNDGVFCLTLAGLTLGEPQLHAFLPPGMEEMVIPDQPVHIMPVLMQGFEHSTQSSDLPGWRVFTP